MAVDIDEVLADFVNTFLTYHNSLYGSSLRKDQVNSYEFWELWDITKEEAIRRVYEFYKTPQFLNLPTIPGAKEGARSLARKHRLVVITSRPYDIYKDTNSWLEKNFSRCFSGRYFTNQWAKADSKYNNHRKKSDICKKLHVDTIIEDSLECALDCASFVKNVILLDCPWNQCKSLPTNVKRVNSWKEITEEILY